MDDIPNGQLIGIEGWSEGGAFVVVTLSPVDIEWGAGEGGRVVEEGSMSLSSLDNVSLTVDLHQSSTIRWVVAQLTGYVTIATWLSINQWWYYGQVSCLSSLVIGRLITG